MVKTVIRDLVSFRFHSRALAALGRDLVTSDVVAVMETSQKRI